MRDRRKIRYRMTSLAEWLHRACWWVDVSTRLARRHHRNSCFGCWSFGPCQSMSGRQRTLFRVISSPVSRRRCDWSADAWRLRVLLRHRRTSCFDRSSSPERSRRCLHPPSSERCNRCSCCSGHSPQRQTPTVPRQMPMPVEVLSKDVCSSISPCDEESTSRNEANAMPIKRRSSLESPSRKYGKYGAIPQTCGLALPR